MSSRNKRNSDRDVAKQPASPSVSNSDDQTEPGGIVARQETYSGPLPHPDMLARYEQIHPGTAERIIQRFENEATHRQTLERQVIDAQIERQNAEIAEIRRGQWFAFVLGAIGLLVGSAVAGFSQTNAGAYAGGAIGGVTLVGLVTAFIAGRRGDQRPTTPQHNDESSTPPS